MVEKSSLWGEELVMGLCREKEMEKEKEKGGTKRPGVGVANQLAQFPLTGPYTPIS